MRSLRDRSLKIQMHHCFLPYPKSCRLDLLSGPIFQDGLDLLAHLNALIEKLPPVLFPKRLIFTAP
jgi:hypothetical protein